LREKIQNYNKIDPEIQGPIEEPVEEILKSNSQLKSLRATLLGRN
jgi:hypothetical protein